MIIFDRMLRPLLAAAMTLLSLAAAGAPVVYSFTGSVSYDEADRGFQAFAGSFSFDSSAPNEIDDPGGSTGSYTGAGAAWSLSLSFDGGAVLDFSSVGFHVDVTNDLGGYDWLGLLGSGSAGTVSAGLYDFTKVLFGDAGLPLRDGGYTMADFGWSDFNWASDEGTLQGIFSSLICTAGCAGTGGDPGGGGNPGGVGGNTVPEPGSWALTATALVVMLCLQRRRPGIRQAAQRLWRPVAGVRRSGGGAASAELGLGQGLMVMGVGR